MKKLTALLLLAVAPLMIAQMREKIVVVGFSDQVANEPRRASPEAEIVSVLPLKTAGVTAISPVSPRTPEDRAELLRQAADADGFIGAPSREVIQAARKLKWSRSPARGWRTTGTRN